ncbi:hypothetical protein J6590_044162 [Homalodisca vitripennis]|nr:hypothetical protein J6590_044162 [Homalodisca vitripennis]
MTPAINCPWTSPLSCYANSVLPYHVRRESFTQLHCTELCTVLLIEYHQCSQCKVTINCPWTSPLSSYAHSVLPYHVRRESFTQLHCTELCTVLLIEYHQCSQCKVTINCPWTSPLSSYAHSVLPYHVRRESFTQLHCTELCTVLLIEYHQCSQCKVTINCPWTSPLSSYAHSVLPYHVRRESFTQLHCTELCTVLLIEYHQCSQCKVTINCPWTSPLSSYAHSVLPYHVRRESFTQLHCTELCTVLLIEYHQCSQCKVTINCPWTSPLSLCSFGVALPRAPLSSYANSVLPYHVRRESFTQLHCTELCTVLLIEYHQCSQCKVTINCPWTSPLSSYAHSVLPYHVRRESFTQLHCTELCTVLLIEYHQCSQCKVTINCPWTSPLSSYAHSVLPYTCVGMSFTQLHCTELCTVLLTEYHQCS